MTSHNPSFTAPTRPTLPEALSGLCLLAMSSSREDHGTLIEKFMDINPDIGVQATLEEAFRCGFVSGYARGLSEEALCEDEAWETFAGGGA